MNWNKEENTELLSAILVIKNQAEAQSFLRDLMTENEIGEFARRLKAAKMLTDKIPYSIIEKQTGLSSTTVARVAKYLNGKEGGYKIIIGRLNLHR